MKLLYKLYGYLFYVIIMLFFPVFMIPIYIFCSWERTYPIVNSLRSYWASITFLLCGYFYKVEWETPIDKKRNYVVVFNHTSHLDILLCLVVLRPMMLRFMAKAELAKLPIFGKYFRTIDFSVDREDANDAKRAFKRADDALEAGHSLAIAPEGGTSKNPPNLRNFKTGAFRLAIQHQVPILVLTFYDNWRIMPSNGEKQGPHISRIKVHTPIETKGMAQDDFMKLSEQVSVLLANDLQQAFPKEFISK